MTKINPFFEKAIGIDESYESWERLNPKPYDKKKASPFTKTRVILMNGTEFEANWYSHQFSRHCNNNNLRREIARIRRREQQQQKIISALKPPDESILETTIGYEQLAVELTAALAKGVKDINVKKALDFALLEDFDHLYRYANLLKMEQGEDATTMVGELTEITPGRPLIAEHRYPADEIKKWICSNIADPFTKLAVNIITAAEQQTMNYYMNVANFYHSELGRKLYAEIAMIEEQHVSQYGSLVDTNCTWLEGLLMHEYVESYLYYSCYCDETDPAIKKLWHKFYLEECGHVQHAAKLLYEYEGKPWQSVFTCGGDFPELLHFESNIEYVRNVLKNTVHLTADMEDYRPVSAMPDDAPFFRYNSTVNRSIADESGHAVIKEYTAKFGSDYRFETAPNPVPSLRNRTVDNTDIGRIKG